MAELNILRIPGRVKQLRLNTAHKIHYNRAPTNLMANLKARDSTQHTRRNQWNFIVPNIKGAEGNTFYFSAIKDWNSLPDRKQDDSPVCQFADTGEPSYFIHQRNVQLDNSPVCQFADTVFKPIRNFLIKRGYC